MGNKYSCDHGTSEYTGELLECVTNVENTSNTLVETLDYHIPLVKKLLTNRVPGVLDTCGSGPSRNRQQLHYHHLEKIDDEKNAVKERVAELLHAVQKKYMFRGKLKKQEHLKTLDSKSGTLEKIELNDLERVWMSKKRDLENLLLEKESNSKIIESQRSEKSKLEKQIIDINLEVEQLRAKAKLFDEQTDTLKSENKASIKKLNETRNELEELRESKAETEKALMLKTQENQGLQLEKDINSKVIATQTSACKTLEKQVTDLKHEVEQLRMNAQLFEEQMDTLKAKNNAIIAELNETTTELATVRKSNTEMENALISKTEDYKNLQLEKESNCKKLATQNSAKKKLEKQITDLKQEVEQHIYKS